MRYVSRLVACAVGVGCAWVLLVVDAPAVAVAAPGELDGSYATGGVFTGGFQTEPPGLHAQFAVVDSQRRTVIAATHVDAQGQSHLDVMRLTAQGRLDPTFNPGGATPGVVEVDFSASVGTFDVLARGVAVTSGDKVVALGWVHDPAHANLFTALVRLGRDGSYDTSFGPSHDGRMVDLRNPNFTSSPDSLAVDPSGRVLVGGSCGSGCGGFVARYTGTGAPDTGGFDASSSHPGILVIANASDVASLAALSDGSVLAAGGISPSDNAVIARIGPDGTLDPTFNSGGATPGTLESGMGRTPGGQTSLATASGVAAGPGGSVYVTGQVVDNGSSMRVLRLTSAGNPDPAFGNGSPAIGVVSVPVASARGVSIAVDGSSCPIAVGSATLPGQTTSDVLAARLTPAGQLDQAFDPAGSTPGTALLAVGDSAFGETIALQDDGNIVIGGYRQQISAQSTDRAAIALRLQGGGCGAGPPAPTLVTSQPTNITSDGATFNGTVNPNGNQVTDCHFDYGPSPQYGSRAACSPSPGAGTSTVAVSSTLSGLGAGKTWNYRLVATGPGGTSTGANQTLTTLTPTSVTTTQDWTGPQGPMEGALITVPAGATGEYDVAALHYAGGGAVPDGYVIFGLYSDSACTHQVLTSSTRVYGGLFSPRGGASGLLPQEPPGTYYWKVDYTGDSSYLPSSSRCGDETLTILPPQPTTLTTHQEWDHCVTCGAGQTLEGASITIPAGASGEFDVAALAYDRRTVPDGYVTFGLYSDPACTHQVFTSSTRVYGGLFSPRGGASGLLPPEPPGTYYWKVDYTGDSSNLPSTSPCGAETLTVARFRISPYGALISTQALTLTMSCAAPPCTVRITMTLPAPLRASDARQKVKSRPPVTILAHGTVTIRKRGSQTVRLRLTAAGRRFVASHHGQVTVNVAVAMTIRGHTRVLNQRLKLKIKTPSKPTQR